MRFKTIPRRAYPSDLTDDQWNLLAALLPPERTDGLGRPREVDLREVVNAILYLNHSGCQWDMLPHDLPHGESTCLADRSEEAPRRDEGLRALEKTLGSGANQRLERSLPTAQPRTTNERSHQAPQ